MIKDQESVRVREITDCSHLIDLSPDQPIFNQKDKGNCFLHPKAKIQVLTVQMHKNGLANLL